MKSGMGCQKCVIEFCYWGDKIATGADAFGTGIQSCVREHSQTVLVGLGT